MRACECGMPEYMVHNNIPNNIFKNKLLEPSSPCSALLSGKQVQRRIVLRGMVEGMGMRPALYRFSRRYGLRGWVRNLSGQVELLWQSEKELLDCAWQELSSAFPASCRLSEPLSFVDSEPSELYDGFNILSDECSHKAVNRIAPPDRAPCAECLAEISDPSNRRYGYAFNACADCGPRTTIIQAFPYDRNNTAWGGFPLCPECRREYEDPSNRRFHVEGISCAACGPRLSFLDRSGRQVCGDPLHNAAELLRNGGILFLKGVGGFQMLADPSNPEAIRRLRKLKNRPHNPLALMSGDIACIRRFCAVSPQEEELLKSQSAPIVLLRWNGQNEFCQDLISPDRPGEAGIMCPASPLHYSLMRAYRSPFVIATSGNREGEPPILDNQSALNNFTGLADGFLMHDRDIYWRYDDSVAFVRNERPHVIRRARGYSSVLHFKMPRRVLALGAGMKNTFAFSDESGILLSPHHGNLENADSFSAWKTAVHETFRRLPKAPEILASDLHPDYPSSRFAAEAAKNRKLPLVQVPHHYAHALAALLESGRQEALAFTFDGTGLGPDGSLWGGELLFVSLNRGGRRLAMFESVPLPGGDAAVREPWRQLAARMFDAGVSLDEARRRLPEHASELEILYRQCELKLNVPATHSAGRLFDAVSALLGLAPDRISYDGQPAIRLEAAAGNETASVGRVWDAREKNGELAIDWKRLFSSEIRLDAGEFHCQFAEASGEMAAYGAEKTGVGTVLFSGGVFQNRLIMKLLSEIFAKKGLEVFIPEQIPMNDGGISCGQAVWAAHGFELKNNGYVSG